LPPIPPPPQLKHHPSSIVDNQREALHGFYACARALQEAGTADAAMQADLDGLARQARSVAGFFPCQPLDTARAVSAAAGALGLEDALSLQPDSGRAGRVALNRARDREAQAERQAQLLARAEQQAERRAAAAAPRRAGSRRCRAR
jgi:hypothetical protein